MVAVIGRAIAGAAARSRTKSAGEAARDALSGVQFNFKSNLSGIDKFLDVFGEDQIPFATAVTLNDTAKDVRGHIIEQSWPSDVKARNRRFMQFALTPISKRNADVYATKRDLRAVVGNTRPKSERDYLQRLAEGGTKTPQGNNLAIEGREAGLKRTQGGAVTKANRPRQLLNRKNVFKVKSKKGAHLIVRRATKQRYPLQVLYLLTPQGKVKKQFKFYDDANATARLVMDKNWKRAFERAKATSKKRAKHKMSAMRKPRLGR